MSVHVESREAFAIERSKSCFCLSGHSARSNGSAYLKLIPATRIQITSLITILTRHWHLWHVSLPFWQALANDESHQSVCQHVPWCVYSEHSVDYRDWPLCSCPGGLFPSHMTLADLLARGHRGSWEVCAWVCARITGQTCQSVGGAPAALGGRRSQV